MFGWLEDEYDDPVQRSRTLWYFAAEYCAWLVLSNCARQMVISVVRRWVAFRQLVLSGKGSPDGNKCCKTMSRIPPESMRDMSFIVLYLVRLE